MTKQTQNLTYKQAADIARQKGYLFTRDSYNGKALFFRPGHHTTAGAIQNYTSAPDLLKEVLNNMDADTPVEFSDYLCIADVSVNGKVTIGQNFLPSYKDVHAYDWKLITDANLSSFIKLAHD
jgi:hypothetical protein